MICNKIITEAHDARDSPLSVLRAGLLVVKQQFRVVDRFDIIPKGGGHYRVMMIASEHEVDDDYTPGREREDSSEFRNNPRLEDSAKETGHGYAIDAEGSNIGKTIHSGKQGKHIVGHNNYQSGKSMLKSDAQSLLDDFHAGNIKSSRIISESKISVDFGKNIGNYVRDGASTPTSVGTVINSKTGVHIVPANPLQY